MSQKNKKAFDTKSTTKAARVDAFMKGGRATSAKKVVEADSTKRGRGRPKKDTDFEARATTLYLQDSYLDDLVILAMTWHKQTKGSEGQEKITLSAALRSVLEVCLPVLEELKDIENEAQLVEELRAKLGQ